MNLMYQPPDPLWSLSKFTDADMLEFVDRSGLDASGLPLDTSVVMSLAEIEALKPKENKACATTA